MAIEKLLRSQSLKAGERRMALAELVRKCRILSQGFYKRGKRKEGRWYEKSAERYRAYGKQLN